MKLPRLLLALLVFSLGLTACKDSSRSGADGGTSGTLRIAVIPKGTTHEFWKSIHAGAIKAERELAEQGTPVEIIWQGPLREDDREQQIQVVENFSNGRADAIVVAPLDSTALVRPIETAMAAGIPVVITDSGLNSENYLSFVATDNFKGGQMAAEYLAGLMHGEGKVILLRYAEGSASTEQREAGFLDVIKGFKKITVISSDQHAGPTIETAYAASQNLLNRFGQEVDGIFAVNESATVGMAKALKEIGRGGGEVKLAGFDAGTQSIQDLANGDVQALVVQDPMKMGYQSVMTIIQHLNGEAVEKRIDTGVVMVTNENMDQPAMNALLHPPLKEYLEE
jgi:ribose transport system substrate-binding protein